MKAWIYRRCGGPEALEWADRDVRQPGRGEIRLKVVAAGLNPLDWKLLDGQFRFMTLGRLPRGVGMDVSGVIDAVGEGVRRFRAGDAAVAAVHPMGSTQGTAAEFVCAKALLAAAKPPALAFTDAAALPGSGFTALQAIRQARVRAGQRALVIGAAGGVGSFAVLLLKLDGLHVSAVSSTGGQEQLARLAPERAIDYSQTDWRKLPERFDFIFDCSGATTYNECREVLAEDGVYANTLPNSTIYCQSWWLAATSRRRIIPVMERPDGRDLEALVALAAAGKLRVPVTRVAEVSAVPALLGEMRAGHGRGKIVVRVAPDPGPAT